MRVAVTGARGRLGSALVKTLRNAAFVHEVLAWDLPEHDLDDASSAERLVAAAGPDAVVHCAAWTDVDGCAHDPGLAMRRNGTAVGEMAHACVRVGAVLVTISTNEVFDGRRADGQPYGPADRPNPANPYGAAKLAGEVAARAAFGASGDDFARAADEPPEPEAGGAPGSESGRGESDGASGVAPAWGLAIVRTAWLFGQPGSDFPQKIIASAERALAEDRSLALVTDEIGNPTYAPDLASAVVQILGAAARPERPGFGGIHHVVNGGHASRAAWAREVLRLTGIEIATNDVPSSAWTRASTPPLWGVLKATPFPGGPLRDWREALAEYVQDLGMNAETRR